MPVQRKGRNVTANPEELGKWLARESGTGEPVHVAQSTDEDLLKELRRGLKAARCGLHFAYYNFCRIHRSLRVTPANGNWYLPITYSHCGNCWLDTGIIIPHILEAHERCCGSTVFAVSSVALLF
jgi:hypothetical protein